MSSRWMSVAVAVLLGGGLPAQAWASDLVAGKIVAVEAVNPAAGSTEIRVQVGAGACLAANQSLAIGKHTPPTRDPWAYLDSADPANQQALAVLNLAKEINAKVRVVVQRDLTRKCRVVYVERW